MGIDTQQKRNYRKTDEEAGRGLGRGPGLLTVLISGQPQYFQDGVVERAQCLQPFAKLISRLPNVCKSSTDCSKPQSLVVLIKECD